MRHGRDVAAEVSLLVGAGWIATVVLLVLIARRRRPSALFAVAFRICVAASFGAVHRCLTGAR